MVRKTSTRLILTALSLFLLTLATARADEPQALTKLADVHLCYGNCTKVQINGEVLQVMKMQYTTLDENPSHAIVLRMQGLDGEFLAYMGPELYLDKMGFYFAPGEKFALEGVLAVVNGRSMLVAESYSNGVGSFVLRNGEGSIALGRR